MGEGVKIDLIPGRQYPAAMPSFLGSEAAAHPLSRRNTSWAPPNATSVSSISVWPSDSNAILTSSEIGDSRANRVPL